MQALRRINYKVDTHNKIQWIIDTYMGYVQIDKKCIQKINLM